MSILKTIPAAACLFALSGALLAARPASLKKQGFENYALLRTRNIFDPERRPGGAPDSSPGTQAAPAQSTSPEYAALTGVMITSEKMLAFFSGSRPEFNAVLATSGTIAGAVLTRITPDSVEVTRGGKRVVVAVGQTVPLDASSVPGTAPAAIPSLPPTSSPASTPLSVDRQAVMRRMMEKRQQELK